MSGLRWTDRQRRMLDEMGVSPWPPAAAPRHDVDAPALPGRFAAAVSRAAPSPSPMPEQRVPGNPGDPGRRAVAAPTVAGAVATHARPITPIVAASGDPPPAPGRPAGPLEPTPAVAAAWQTLQGEVATCTACGLCRTRTQTVFGVGGAASELMVIGEAPGAEEDARGEPFVGAAGRLLDRMLGAIGRSRAVVPSTMRDAADPPSAAAAEPSPVFIANVLKCRPPGNRNPQPDEIERCRPYLLRQVALVRPRVVLALGRFAIDTLLADGSPISRLRGRTHEAAGLADLPPDVPRPLVIVSYHPAYLLRQPQDKARAWDDLRRVADLLR